MSALLCPLSSRWVPTPVHRPVPLKLLSILEGDHVAPGEQSVLPRSCIRFRAVPEVGAHLSVSDGESES